MPYDTAPFMERRQAGGVDRASPMWEAGPGRSRLVAAKGSEQVATLRGPATASLPQGVVTFLLTDVEGSSRLWEADAAAMRAAMSLHDELVERAVGASGGLRPVEQGEGDRAVVAF